MITRKGKQLGSDHPGPQSWHTAIDCLATEEAEMGRPSPASVRRIAQELGVSVPTLWGEYRREVRAAGGARTIASGVERACPARYGAGMGRAA